jgi:hypothetical protein
MLHDIFTEPPPCDEREASYPYRRWLKEFLSYFKESDYEWWLKTRREEPSIRRA